MIVVLGRLTPLSSVISAKHDRNKNVTVASVASLAIVR